MIDKTWTRDVLIGLMAFALVVPAVALAEVWTGDDNGNYRVGTPTRDQYDGRGGGDWLEGRGGSDSLSGDQGADVLLGGDDGGAYDYIGGGPDGDTQLGGEGDDRIYSGPGNDEAQGENGNDSVIVGEGGDDKLRGGENNDVLYAFEAGGSDADSVVDGGSGFNYCQVNSNDNYSNCVPF